MAGLVLASLSPRRRELMKLLGHPFSMDVSDVDEEILENESPETHVKRLSEMKAMKIGAKRKEDIVIGADTIVVLDDRMLGKPSSLDEAVEMIMYLQGRTHWVYTGFALYQHSSDRLFSDYSKTSVTMRRLDKDLAKRYVETGEPMDKAGSYGIQGYGASLVLEIKGDYFTVMGLPIARLMESLYTFSDGEFGYFGIRHLRSGT